MTFTNPRVINLAWIFVEKFGVIAISISTFFVYASILSPSQLGLGVLAVAIVETCGVVYSNLIENPLVRRDNITQRQASSVFWFGGLLSVLTSVVIVVICSRVSGDSLMLALLAVASLKILFSVLLRPFVVELRQKRNFKKLTQRTVLGRLSGAAVGIYLALSGSGPWAIVAQAVAVEFVALCLVMFNQWRLIAVAPQFALFKSVFVEGIPTAIRTLCSTFTERGVIIALGITTSTEMVGYFSFANRLVALPREAIGAGLTSYALPAISSRVNRGDNVSGFVGQLTHVVAMVMLPLFIGLSALGGDVVEIIFGDKWINSIMLLQFLAILAAIKTLVIFVPSTLVAYGKARVGLNAVIANSVLTLATVLTLTPLFGIEGVLMALSIQLAIDLMIKYWSLAKVTLQSSRQSVIAILKVSLAAAVMGAVLHTGLIDITPMTVDLLLSVCLGGMIYIVALSLINPAWFKQARALLNRSSKA